jgi:capsular polysaccharide biosynthesis protein
MKSRAFAIVQLANMSLRDQIETFRSARVIVGTHGAGLSNIVWSSGKDVAVVEIATDVHPRCFEWLSEAAGHRYQRIQAPQTKHWEADLSELAAAIEWAS